VEFSMSDSSLDSTASSQGPQRAPATAPPRPDTSDLIVLDTVATGPDQVAGVVFDLAAALRESVGTGQSLRVTCVIERVADSTIV
jgi:hypothetical protein